ncbi:hypothetical protein M422DRAFT_30475 [Sphaerobolus stellatus SS14]|uniref:Zn(2)-C6 fungal-type domain-containing protein n=1 Tax=Sphaerobolus stellatus (strain SS14) TaxID=990650 RepID=A0A0C9VZ26_SPHS4|nr:hypothetical protein M422DRAFT_30475 [Sphaerobolus stellatus SS14]
MATALDDVARKRGCRECRRLKLGCERKWPCQNCRKRGCADICPDGIFTKGMRSTKNERLVMHERIGEMSSRITLLKNAIEQLQSLVSTEPHPLLREETDQGMHPVVNTQPKKPISTPEEDIIRAFGAFSIGGKGEISFHEASATSEYLLVNPSPKSPSRPSFHQQPSTISGLPPDLLLLSALFPFPPDTIRTTVMHFLAHLPPYPRAQFLVKSYFDNGAWSVDPVHKEDFLHRVLTECYPNGQPCLDTISADRLSVLFMVFTVGAFFDFEQALVPREAEDFYIMARAALCVQPIYDHPTVYAVQSMTLMMWYQTLAGHRTHAYRPLLWGVLQTACELMYLNRDPEKLDIHGVEADVRRVAFWEVKSIEHWQTFTSGRPAATSILEDCKQPYEDAFQDPEAKEADSIVWLGWKQHFTDLVNTVADQAFRSKDVTYSKIMSLDKQLRHHSVPPALRWPSTKGAMYQKLGRNRLTGMQCLARIVLQESALLHLHRWFFMQAVREKPLDPLEHPYSFSVRTVYQSASAVLMALSTMYGYHPVLVSRCKTAWAAAFSAGLTMGTLVVSAPTIPLAHPAMIEFERACTLFRTTATSSVQPENASAVLMDLLALAQRAREEGIPQTRTPESPSFDDGTPRSSQSPISASSHQSWTPAPSSGSSSHMASISSRRNLDDIEEDDPDTIHYKREYEPAEVRANLSQWWQDAQREN